MKSEGVYFIFFMTSVYSLKIAWLKLLVINLRVWNLKGNLSVYVFIQQH